MKADYLRRARLVSRIAFLALAFVLAAVLAFAGGSATTLAAATAHVRDVSTLGDAYADASRAVDREELHETKFHGASRPDVAAHHAEAARSFRDAVARVRRFGTASDRQSAALLLDAQRRYESAASDMFAAIRAHALARAARIESGRVEPPFDEIRKLVDREHGTHHREAALALSNLIATERTLSRIAPFVTVVGMVAFVVLALILQTYRKRVERGLARDLDRLSAAAFCDNLTALGNHRAFHDTIASAIRQADIESGPLVLALIDIDDFKVVNDKLGHGQGDRVLRMLGELLRDPSLGARAFRVGGDEFALLIEGTIAEGTAAAEEVRAAMVRSKIGATISAGVAAWRSGMTVHTLNEHADATLYEAKRRGRDQVVAYDAVADVVSILTSVKVNAVRRVIDERAVTIYFQPIVDMATSSILGYEALSRFPGVPEAPPPDESFAIAERIGRAYDLDDVCVGAIFARAAELPHTARLFINVSPQTLDHDTFVDRLSAAAMLAAISPERVVVELTERSMERPLSVIREANRLRAAGFRLALDDVGSGNAGLALLGSLSVEFIKIDRSVVSAAASGRAGRAVYAGILAIARENGSYVIAEGIEDEAMFRFVGANREIRGLQGYHLGLPAPRPQPARRLAIAR